MRFHLIRLCLLLALACHPLLAKPVMLIVHGAWGGAWQFAKIDSLLREQGYDVRRVTLTGLGERAHFASPDIELETHIEDVLNVTRFEDLADIILVGQSYGGMVISGVADRLPERIARLVYLDAMVPDDGDSAAALIGNRLPLSEMTRDGFIIPVWVKPGKPHPIDVPHPLKTFTDPISLKNPDREKSRPHTFSPWRQVSAPKPTPSGHPPNAPAPVAGLSSNLKAITIRTGANPLKPPPSWDRWPGINRVFFDRKWPASAGRLSCSRPT